jgi:hypothetical protein
VDGEKPRADGDLDGATDVLLRYVLLPGWYVPGLLDWWYHRRSRIEHNAGVTESLMHALQMAECGAGIALGIVCEIDAGVLAVLAGIAALHTATAYVDVAYANGRREIVPGEQHVHSFLETLPLATLAMTACRHPRQWRALLGLSSERPRFAFKLKRPIPLGYFASVMAGSIAFIALPYAEELLRCVRYRPSTGSG